MLFKIYNECSLNVSYYFFFLVATIFIMTMPLKIRSLKWDLKLSYYMSCNMQTAREQNLTNLEIWKIEKKVILNPRTNFHWLLLCSKCYASQTSLLSPLGCWFSNYLMFLTTYLQWLIFLAYEIVFRSCPLLKIGKEEKVNKTPLSCVCTLQINTKFSMQES